MYKAQRSGVKALYLGASRTIREREAEIEPVLEIRRAQSLRPDHRDPYRNRKFGIMSGSPTIAGLLFLTLLRLSMKYPRRAWAPYVIMRRIADGMINKDEVANFESDASKLTSPSLF
jgi:hypothetical protein